MFILAKRTSSLRRIISGIFCLKSITALVTVGTQCHRRLVVEKRPDTFGGIGVFAVADSIAPKDVLFALAAEDIPVGTVINSELDINVLQPLVSSNNKAVSAIYSLATALTAWKLLDDYSVTNTPLHSTTKRILESGLSTALSQAAADLPWSTIQWQIPMCWSADTLNSALILAAEDIKTSADGGRESFALETLLEGKRRTRILRQYASRLSTAVCTALEMSPDDSLMIQRVCRQTVALVASRMFTLKDTRTIALLPLIDCINHSSCSPNARLVDTGDVISVVATTTIPKDAQVYISYGCPAAEDAFATYGFIPQGISGGSSMVEQALARALEVGQAQTKAELEIRH